MAPFAKLPWQLLPAQVSMTPSSPRPSEQRSGWGGTRGPPLPALNQACLLRLTVASKFNVLHSFQRLKNRCRTDGTQGPLASCSPSGRVLSLCPKPGPLAQTLCFQPSEPPCRLKWLKILPLIWAFRSLLAPHLLARAWGPSCPLL